MSFFRKTAELLRELRSHALWDGVKESIANAGLICGSLVAGTQWLRHHFNWFFVVSICVVAVSFGGIGIGIGRRLKGKSNSKPETSVPPAPTPEKGPSVTSKTANADDPDKPHIEIASLEQIKQYDAKYRKITAASGTLASVIVCFVGVGIVLGVVHHDEEADLRTRSELRNKESELAEVIKMLKLEVALRSDEHPNVAVLADSKTHIYYCTPADWPSDRLGDAILLLEADAARKGYKPYMNVACTDQDEGRRYAHTPPK